MPDSFQNLLNLLSAFVYICVVVTVHVCVWVRVHALAEPLGLASFIFDNKQANNLDKVGVHTTHSL